MRLLLRRSARLDTCFPMKSANYSATDAVGKLVLNQTRMPCGPGYDTNAYLTQFGVMATSTVFRFNDVFMTPLAWMAPAFLAYRGSIRWHYNLDNTGYQVPHNVSVTRRVKSLYPNAQELVGNYLGFSTDAQTLDTWRYNMRNQEQGTAISGCFYTNPGTQTGINVEFPYMTKYRFSYARPTNALLGDPADGTDEDTYCIETMVHPASANAKYLSIQRFVGIGTDFNFFMYLNAPVVYYSSTFGRHPAT